MVASTSKAVHVLAVESEIHRSSQRRKLKERGLRGARNKVEK